MELGYHKRGLCEECKILEKHLFNCTPDDPCFGCQERAYIESRECEDKDNFWGRSIADLQLPIDQKENRERNARVDELAARTFAL